MADVHRLSILNFQKISEWRKGHGVGRRIEGDANSKLFFQLFSRRLRSAFCKCIMLSKMLHTAGIDFSFYGGGLGGMKQRSMGGGLTSTSWPGSINMGITFVSRTMM